MMLQFAHTREIGPQTSKQMTVNSRHDQTANKIANVDLNKKPANDHEKRLQNIKRFLLKADWLDEN